MLMEHIYVTTFFALVWSVVWFAFRELGLFALDYPFSAPIMAVASFFAALIVGGLIVSLWLLACEIAEKVRKNRT